MKNLIEKGKDNISNFPDTFLFVLSYLCALSLWPLDIYLYQDLTTPFYILIKIFFLTLFIIFYVLIAIFSYIKRGNVFYIGLIVYILAYILITLPLFGIYLPLYDEAPWGNSLAAESFYLGCFLLLCGGFLLNFDIYFEKKRIILDVRKVPTETQECIMRSFLFVSGLFFAMNLWDYNGLLFPIYNGYEYAPEPLILGKVQVMVQFTINSLLIGIWMIILIYFLYKKEVLQEFKVKASLALIFSLIVISAVLIFTTKINPIPYELQRRLFQPLPAFIVIIPLLVILKVSFKHNTYLKKDS